MVDITKHGMEGNYGCRFKLSNWHLEKGRLSLGHVSNLRNNIRDHDLKFAKLIRSNGHDTFFAPACDSTSVEQSDWIGKVATILDKTKGEELQTHVDPKRIGLFFWDYSKGWEEIALGHIQAISDECEKFLRWVVQSILKDIFPSLVDTLFNMHVRPKLKRRFNEARQELAKLEFDRERVPSSEDRKPTRNEPQRMEDSDASTRRTQQGRTRPGSLGKPGIFGEGNQVGQHVG
jgi:hypothetical protein